MILIIEDNKAMAAAIAEILRLDGYEVLTAVTGMDGLELLEQHPGVKLIILDLGLPGGMVGSQVVKRIRQSGNDVPILVSSGHDMMRVLSEWGNMEGIRKPYDTGMLLAVVKRMLEE